RPCPTSASVTPSAGSAVRRCAPRSRNGSSAPASSRPSAPRKKPKQSTTTATRRVFSVPPLAAANAAAATPTTTRAAPASPRVLLRIGRHPHGVAGARDLDRPPGYTHQLQHAPRALADAGHRTVERARDPERG